MITTLVYMASNNMCWLQGETPLDLAKQRKNVWMINHLQEARQAKGYDSPSYLKRLKMDKVEQQINHHWGEIQRYCVHSDVSLSVCRTSGRRWCWGHRSWWSGWWDLSPIWTLTPGSSRVWCMQRCGSSCSVCPSTTLYYPSVVLLSLLMHSDVNEKHRG